MKIRTNVSGSLVRIYLRIATTHHIFTDDRDLFPLDAFVAGPVLEHGFRDPPDVPVDEQVSVLHGRVTAIARLRGNRRRARVVPVAVHSQQPAAVAYERVAPVAR